MINSSDEHFLVNYLSTYFWLLLLAAMSIIDGSRYAIKVLRQAGGIGKNTIKILYCVENINIFCITNILKGCQSLLIPSNCLRRKE